LPIPSICTTDCSRGNVCNSPARTKCCEVQFCNARSHFSYNYSGAAAYAAATTAQFDYSGGADDNYSGAAAYAAATTAQFDYSGGADDNYSGAAAYAAATTAQFDYSGGADDNYSGAAAYAQCDYKRNSGRDIQTKVQEEPEQRKRNCNALQIDSKGSTRDLDDENLEINNKIFMEYH
jgi:hypothetical protein